MEGQQPSSDSPCTTRLWPSRFQIAGWVLLSAILTCRLQSHTRQNVECNDDPPRRTEIQNHHHHTGDPPACLARSTGALHRASIRASSMAIGGPPHSLSTDQCFKSWGMLERRGAFSTGGGSRWSSRHRRSRSSGRRNMRIALILHCRLSTGKGGRETPSRMAHCSWLPGQVWSTPEHG